LEKRKDVLERRHEYIDKIGKILTNLQYQIELLEDTVRPDQRPDSRPLARTGAGRHRGRCVQTDSMTRLLEELAPFDQAADRLAA
jgi:hypothetical protein